MKIFSIRIKFWQILTLSLFIFDIALYTKSIFGSIYAIAFATLLPGIVLLTKFKLRSLEIWTKLCLALALSLLFLMIVGISLNSLYYVGLKQPLSSVNIAITINVIFMILIYFVRHEIYDITLAKLTINIEKLIVGVLLTTLPILAIAGAFRLNNGSSDATPTMIAFLLIGMMTVYIIIRHRELSGLYPYAYITFCMTILFSNSMRGWLVTGHDIQHEFQVFQSVSKTEFWNMLPDIKDPYNACISITILPTIFQKLTIIPAEYVYKMLFQIITSLGLVSIYLFAKQFIDKRAAFISAFLFITFPPFLNDLPFLNRQEIAFVFFGNLLLVSALDIKLKVKTALSFLLLFGAVLSHYSSTYVLLVILFFAWAIVKIVKKYFSPKDLSPKIPILSANFIFVTLLVTFMWNTQVTLTSGGLRDTLSSSARGLMGDDTQSKSSGVQYSILSSSPTKPPQQVINEYTDVSSQTALYVPQEPLPLTKFGKSLNKYIPVAELNTKVRSSFALVLQALLLVGLGIYTYRLIKTKDTTVIIFALSSSCTILFVLVFLVPVLSVNYSVTRIVQQSLMVTAIPTVLGLIFILKPLRHPYLISSFLISFMFLHLSGLIPQITGGLQPQLSLNNQGVYYDIYYHHFAEKIAANWVLNTKTDRVITADSYAKARFENYPFISKPIETLATTPPVDKYIYNDYVNLKDGLYYSFLNGDVLAYKFIIEGERNVYYSNNDSNVERIKSYEN